MRQIRSRAGGETIKTMLLTVAGCGLLLAAADTRGAMVAGSAPGILEGAYML